MQLIERVTGAGRVDRQNHIIRNVKIVGTESKNGYHYSPEALREGVSLYEGVSVNISHPRRDEVALDRSILESPGWLSNVRYEIDGLYGDLNLFESHPSTQLIMEKAEKNPTGFGLSHNADGHRERVRGQLTITKLSRVRSVDIVGVPATTAGIFESVQEDSSDPYERQLAKLRRLKLECVELMEARDRRNSRPQDPAEKSYAEINQELRQFGRVMNPESEYDRVLLEEHREENPARLSEECGSEYDRVRAQLRGSGR